jgi:NADH:ubiquinone oxidoreductase subunit H
MARPRGTAAEREREAREQAQRKAKLSLRVGGLGIVVLFLSGFGVWLLPEEIALFLGGMVLGIVLVMVALSLVWGFAGRLRIDDETKILFRPP